MSTQMTYVIKMENEWTKRKDRTNEGKEETKTEKSVLTGCGDRHLAGAECRPPTALTR